MNQIRKTPAKPSPQIWTGSSGPAALMRLRVNAGGRFETPSPPPRDAVAFIVQLEDFADHTLWRDGRVAHKGGHAGATLSIADMTRRIRCEHRSSCDNFRFIVDRQALAEWSKQEGLTRVDFSVRLGLPDLTLFNLCQALAPTLAAIAPSPWQRLFLDQTVLAAMAHLAITHGGAAAVKPAQGLDARQLRLATEYLGDQAHDRLALDVVATLCGLPPGMFVSSFKAATGVAPQRWALNLRLERALAQLLDGQAPDLVAVQCGFANAEALFKAFARQAGVRAPRRRDPRSWH